MSLLNHLVSVLNKEELRSLKLWLNSTNASDNRKDIQLLDYIRKTGEKYNEEHIFKKLYSQKDKNSFYKLKHRLQEDVGNHLALQHTDKLEVNYLLHNLSLHNIFMSRNQPILALHYLKKTEKRAQQTENLELLDIIYASFTRLAADLTEINPEEYIQKQKDNAIQLNRIREADHVLAAVTYRLKLSQNYGTKDVGLMKLLQNTIREFAADASIQHSKIFQTRIFRAVSQTLIQNHNFEELEKFMLVTYKKFVDENWFDKTNHETKIQMLIYIINATFKNRKYRESLDYAEALGEELSKFSNLLYDKYLFFYYNALVINYAQIDLTRGLRALEEAEREMKSKKNSYHDFFIYWNKATLLFHQGKFNEAIRNLTRLYVNDYFKKADVSLKMKIAVAECIMQYESTDKETTLKRIEQVIKQFKEQLALNDFKRERFILNLIPQLISVEGVDKGKKLFSQVKKFVLSPVKGSVEDGEVLRYRAWLAPKVEIGIETLDG